MCPALPCPALDSILYLALRAHNIDTHRRHLHPSPPHHQRTTASLAVLFCLTCLPACLPCSALASSLHPSDLSPPLLSWPWFEVY
ncbi:hypothetical protein DL98DRAFT_126687 [Cadophora sp. DSE1049]|nr:hypothetical protein DL98DRAFT_126687 [Cadophora sp. DSE1049]